MTKELIKMSVKQIRDLLLRREVSVTELIHAAFERIEQNKSLNAFISVTEREAALASAKTADSAYANGSARKWEGIPIAQKDNFATRGVKTTAGSRILHNFIPPYDSTISQKLNNSGAITLGKTNMDEFAMGSATVTSCFGPTYNPWRKINEPEVNLVPGGSSGGSAVAVAADMVCAATGTDTGGSIRQPAALCGLVGVKPTYGRCSRYGIVAFASSLDQAGTFTRTVSDAAEMLEIIAGYDQRDATSAQREVEPFSQQLGKSIRGMKVGIPKEYMSNQLPEEIECYYNKTSQWLQEAGAELVSIELPNIKYSLPTYYVIAPAEASSNLSRFDGVRYGLRVPGKSLEELYENTRGEGFGCEVKRRIMMGTYVLSAGYYDAYYTKAQKVRNLIAQDFERAFTKVDVILSPTSPSAAFAWGEEQSKDPINVYLNDIFTVPINLAGLPALSVPVALNNDGLPLGMQLIAPSFAEVTLFNVAEKIEEAAQFSKLKNLA